MTKERAAALFEQVLQALAGSLHEYKLSLVYDHPGTMFGMDAWFVRIESWGNTYDLFHEKTWERYKREHAILETDQDLEEYADAARAEAERELEQDETTR